MKALRNTLLALVVLVAILAATVNYLAVPMEQLPPPDPAMPIALPDGRQTTLADLVASTRDDRPTGLVGRAVQDAAEGDTPPPADAAGDDGMVAVDPDPSRHWRLGDEQPPDGSDLYDLARYTLFHGESDQALALLQSVPESHPRFADAQRDIGWRIYTEERDRPALGVAYVNRALNLDPFSGNAWQDASRVYLATLGLPVN